MRTCREVPRHPGADYRQNTYVVDMIRVAPPVSCTMATVSRPVPEVGGGHYKRAYVRTAAWAAWAAHRSLHEPLFLQSITPDVSTNPICSAAWYDVRKALDNAIHEFQSGSGDNLLPDREDGEEHRRRHHEQ